MIHLYADRTGREPTRSRTAISNNGVTCVLEGVLTPGERDLACSTRITHLPVLRRHQDELMHPDALREIERITARRVLDFAIEDHVDPDRAVFTWVLGNQDWTLALQRAADLDGGLAEALRMVDGEARRLI